MLGWRVEPGRGRSFYASPGWMCRVEDVKELFKTIIPEYPGVLRRAHRECVRLVKGA